MDPSIETILCFSQLCLTENGLAHFGNPGYILSKIISPSKLEDFELLTVLNACVLSVLQSFANDNQLSQGKSLPTLD